MLPVLAVVSVNTETQSKKMVDSRYFEGFITYSSIEREEFESKNLEAQIFISPYTR